MPSGPCWSRGLLQCRRKRVVVLGLCSGLRRCLPRRCGTVLRGCRYVGAYTHRRTARGPSHSCAFHHGAYTRADSAGWNIYGSSIGGRWTIARYTMSRLMCRRCGRLSYPLSGTGIGVAALSIRETSTADMGDCRGSDCRAATSQGQRPRLAWEIVEDLRFRRSSLASGFRGVFHNRGFPTFPSGDSSSQRETPVNSHDG